MSPSKRKDPAEAFIEIQEHRYDPGYWVLKVKRGGLPSAAKELGEVQLSTIGRTLALFVLLCPMVIGTFFKYRDNLSHPWIYCAAALFAVFTAIWYWMRRSLKRYGLTGTGNTQEKKP